MPETLVGQMCKLYQHRYVQNLNEELKGLFTRIVYVYNCVKAYHDVNNDIVVKPESGSKPILYIVFFAKTETLK